MVVKMTEMESDHEREWSLAHRLERASRSTQRHCSICRAPTDGAPLCDRCAWRMRNDCKLVHLAIAAGAYVGSGAIRNLRQDEALVKEYDEWEEAQCST